MIKISAWAWRKSSVADPDLQIKGKGGGRVGGGRRSSRLWDKGGGGGLKKNFFRPFRPRFGLKNKGAPSLDPPLVLTSKNY